MVININKAPNFRSFLIANIVEKSKTKNLRRHLYHQSP